MGTKGVSYVDSGIEYEIRHDIVHIIFGDQGTFAMPLSVCEREHFRLGQIMALHRAKTAEIIPLPKRPPKHRGNHAARS